MAYKIVIEGPPISKKRPRFAKRGNFVATYSIQKDVEGIAQTQIVFQLRDQGIIRPIEGPISVEMAFHMPIPKSYSKKLKMNLGKGHVPHVKKPDCDNLQKFYLDAMNGIAYNDDCQVWHIEASKTYSDNPRTEIILTVVPV